MLSSLSKNDGCNVWGGRKDQRGSHAKFCNHVFVLKTNRIFLMSHHLGVGGVSGQKKTGYLKNTRYRWGVTDLLQSAVKELRG